MILYHQGILSCPTAPSSFVVQYNFNGEGATFKASMYDYHRKFKCPALIHES
jgi:hypothetical protein